MRLTFCLLNISESPQTKFIAVANLVEEQFLKNELARNKGKVSEMPSGNSDTNNDHRRRTRPTTQENVGNKVVSI